MSEKEVKPIEIQGFESFLRKSLDCEQLQLVKLEASNMLPLGENYSSTIIKLDATIRREKNGAEEELHLIAKKRVNTEREIANWSDVLSNETYVYTDLLPAYEKLERDMGIDDVFDAYPKYVGHRYSLDEKDTAVSDEHSMLVMENLKPRGFYIGDKQVGLDLEHARLALKALARFHALGIALKTKRPEMKIVDRIILREKFEGDFTSVDMGFDSVLNTIRSCNDLKKHLPVIERVFAESKNGMLWARKPTEPWATIIHGDFWLNNMMFRKDADGRVAEVKLVDFQIGIYSSPLKDLPSFICASVDETTRLHHFDELLDLYYDSFLAALKRLDCEVEPYNRQAFECELKKQAIIQFPLCALAFKFLRFNITEQQDSGTLIHEIFTSEIDNEFVQNLKLLVGIYERKGWL